MENKIICSVKQACVGEVLEKLQEDFKKTTVHINTKRIQHAHYLSDKNNEFKRVLHFDFAMNYSCEYQNEIQSALWSRKSVTLFTAISTYKGQNQSYLICSNTNKKDKNTVSHFIKKLFEIMTPNAGDILEVDEIFWSDGPSSEFKNKFMVLFLQKLGQEFGKTFIWKYFATSHGKGAVDGIGGRAKSLVRTRVMSKATMAPVVQNAEDFANVAKEVLPNVTVLYISEDEIPRDNKMWEKAPEIPGIKTKHIIKVAPACNLKLYILMKMKRLSNAHYNT